MAATEPTTRSPIETLFRPTTRFRDSRRNRGCGGVHQLPENITEAELLPGLTTENVWATGITWEDFRLFCRDKLVWMTPGVYVCIQYAGDPLVLLLGGDLGGTTHTTDLRVRVTRGMATAVAMATCDFLVRLLATSELRAVYILGSHRESPPLSGETLSLFFQESRSCLRKVFLSRMSLTEDQCRALATRSRLDVELVMLNCSLVDDAAGAFVECLQSDEGPITLHNCKIDNQIIATALTGTSRVSRLKLEPANDTENGMIFRALANNKGLVYLDLQDCAISDDNWSILCESLKAHPTLTRLNLRISNARWQADERMRFSDQQKTSRTRALAEMVQHNAVLHTITASDEGERDEHIFAEEILPHLDTNLYRPRVLAVTKTKERPFAKKVLGRALHCVKSSPNLVWMFLSENVDALVRSEEETYSSIEVAAAAVAVVAAGIGSKRKRS
jgi:hypothetical protein